MALNKHRRGFVTLPESVHPSWQKYAKMCKILTFWCTIQFFFFFFATLFRNNSQIIHIFTLKVSSIAIDHAPWCGLFPWCNEIFRTVNYHILINYDWSGYHYINWHSKWQIFTTCLKWIAMIDTLYQKSTHFCDFWH